MEESIKPKLYTRCQEYINEKISTLKNAIKEAQDAANDQTKSSAGDKYETGRAMMQIEKDNHSKQLAEILKLKKVLDQTDGEKIHLKAGLGSIVVTDQGNFYLTISAGLLKVENTDFFVISPVSPLGQQFSGCIEGENITFNQKKYHILQVL